MDKHNHPKRTTRMNSKDLFGLEITDDEQDYFLKKLDIAESSLSLEFLSEIVCKVIQTIPFQNFKMIERGFGHIPTEKEIKEDMLSFQGGTCATMNTFMGAILHNLGFDVCLINGTMMNTNDHIAILLNINNQGFVIDVGDGQPYFKPIAIDHSDVINHPFRTYKTRCENSSLAIDFLINSKWVTDVTHHLKPKLFSEIYNTLEMHYTQKEFGPFWKGIRFAIYPNKKIIALRDNLFIIQKDNSIDKIEIQSTQHLTKLITEHLPEYKEQLITCFTKFNAYDYKR